MPESATESASAAPNAGQFGEIYKVGEERWISITRELHVLRDERGLGSVYSGPMGDLVFRGFVTKETVATLAKLLE